MSESKHSVIRGLLSQARAEGRREGLAAAVIAEDNAEPGERISVHFEWALRVIDAGKDDEHFGDCIKMPCTCTRCMVDDSLAHVDRALAQKEGKDG